MYFFISCVLSILKFFCDLFYDYVIIQRRMFDDEWMTERDGILKEGAVAEPRRVWKDWGQ